MNQTTDSDVETPTGKGAEDENFPVGSFLLPRHLRPHVATFYNLARATDDIADNGNLAAEDKLGRLDRFEKALTGELADDPALVKSHAVVESAAETGVPVQHSIDLLHAFKQDAVKLRYDDWDDLIGYCNLSAAPVGRFLLDLHGEDPAKYPYSDALCNVLQILNHLQDLKDDYRTLDRVYLPGDWMAAEGVTVTDLDAAAASPGLRRVIDRCLDGCDGLLAEARRLPGQLENRRLCMESAVIVRLAARLTARLRKGDPIAGRVALSKADFILCGISGAVAGFLGL
ncbi:MAG: squalene synthase HpnC [Alphaproteobacteria bacterium]